MNQPVVENLSLAELSDQPASATGARTNPPRIARDIDLIRHVQVSLTATIGTADISIEKLFSLRDGDVITLRELVSEPVTLCIDSRPVARGLLVAVDDNLGVEVTEILAS